LYNQNTCTGSIPGAAEKYGLEIGDHAIAEQIVPCWECRYCKRGSYQMCECEEKVCRCVSPMMIQQ